MSDITEFLLDEAKKKYGNDVDAELFVNGFVTKMASIFSGIKGSDGNFPDFTSPRSGDREPRFGSSLAKGIGEQAGRALMTGAAATAVAGIASLVGIVKGHHLYNLFIRALNEAIQNNRVLKAADKQKVLAFGHSIFKFAPHVATDTNILSSILANAIHGDSLDPMTIRTLTELESRYRDTTGFDPKRWI